MIVRANKLALLAVVMVLVLAPAAFADTLAKHGPIVPYIAGPPHSGNGYPRYYMDRKGQVADSQVPPFGDGVTAPTMIYGPIPAGTTDQFTLDIGFDAEFFYFLAIPDRATFDDVVGANLNIVIGLEAGFAGLGATVNGQQAVFQRIRFFWAALTVLPPPFTQATFLFKHPYGTETITVTNADLGSQGGGGIRYTVDSPVATNIPPLNFDVALGDNPFAPGKIGPFLQQVNPAPQILALNVPAGFNKPTDWFGDGITPATFTGSPAGTNGSPTGFNKFRLEAWANPDGTGPINMFPTVVGGPLNRNFVETDLAVISGHRLHFPNLAGLEMLLLLDDQP
jgi:hypothetical protein